MDAPSCTGPRSDPHHSSLADSGPQGPSPADAGRSEHPEGLGPIFDAHLHIVDPRFPLVPNLGWLPEPFTVRDYRAAILGLGVRAGAVVAASFQGRDRSWLRAALAGLGPGFVGVAELPPEVSDAEIRALDRIGVRAVRFNLHRGTAGDTGAAARLGRRVFDLVGWHSELYLDAAELPDLPAALRGLPRLVVDHLGLSRPGLPHLLRLVGHGAWVKASGFARLDFDPVPTLAAIHRERPEAALFGTDLPGTRAPRAFAREDLTLIREALSDPEAVRHVLWDNALALYRRAD